MKNKDCCEEEQLSFEDVLLNKAVQNRRIYLWGEVNDLMAASTIDQLYYQYEKNPSLPVHLLINSPGGCVTSCEAMMDEMVILQGKGLIINTICVGAACSAAAVVLAMGTRGYRYARPNSTIMLHPISFGLESDYIDAQKKMTAFIERRTLVFNMLIAKALGKDLKKYIKDVKDGLWMSADEAVKHGVIDEVNLEPLKEYKDDAKPTV